MSGQAIGIVKEIGAGTELGKIGKALESLEVERTPLQIQTSKVVRTFAITGGVFCALVVVVYWLTRGNLLEGFLAGLSLAMAMLPRRISGCYDDFFSPWRLAYLETSRAYTTGFRYRNTWLGNGALC